ncbi:hypothetical protein [Amycolatopsis sp. NPDC051061]|uniref:hypothetical protein n=1 Tax=Amycolatopsis sp. NPDC051061 TaxID=3155042 RepID=UPI00343194F5
MQVVGYWEAWSLWWSGQKVDGMEMWGLPMHAWARMGKLAQYAGGLVAVLDLIGHERLNKTSTSIANYFKGFARRQRKSIVESSIITTIAVGGLGIYQMLNGPSSGRSWPLTVLIIFLYLLAFSFLFGLITTNIDKIIYPLTRILQAQHQSHPVRWFAFFLVTLGFSFDLLAS